MADLIEVEDLPRALEPGRAVKIWFNARNRNNRTMHIRAVVDGDRIVSRVWTSPSRGWAYVVDSMSYYECLAHSGCLFRVKG